MSVSAKKSKKSKTQANEANEEYLISRGAYSPEKDKDVLQLQQENENLKITNKILNKSNIDLKIHIKVAEEDLEEGKERKFMLNDMEKLLENYKEDQEKLKYYIVELLENIENLKKLSMYSSWGRFVNGTLERHKLMRS